MEATEFGAYLKELREQAGLSMGELAKKANVSQPYISQLENGQRGIPSLDVMRKLAEAFGTNYFHMNVRAGYLRGNEWIKWGLDELEEANTTDDFTNEIYRAFFKNWLKRMSNEITDYRLKNKDSTKIFTNQSFNIRFENLIHSSDSYSSNSVLQNPIEGGKKSISLEEIINNVPSLTFQGRILNSKDRERILLMLSVLFQGSEIKEGI